MTIKNYLTCKDFKKVVEEKIVNTTNIKLLLRKRGILPVCASSTDLAKMTYRFFWGYEFTTMIVEHIDTEQNNLKSTLLIIKPKEDINDNGYIQDLANEFINQKNIPNTPYKISCVNKREDSIGIDLRYTYNKSVKGKMSVLENKEINLDISITPIKENFKVNIKHEGISDSKNFVNFIDKMMNNPDSQSSFKLSRIRLESLNADNKVNFFDKFGNYKYKEWFIRDITSVSLCKKTDENEETIDNQESSLDSNTVVGISSAILNGAGLRKVSFVEDCMQKGFFFQSMRFKLEHKSLPLILEIDISFKQTDLKVIIYKAMTIDDEGKNIKTVLNRNEQSNYIDYFQNVAYEIYTKLVTSQKLNSISK